MVCTIILGIWKNKNVRCNDTNYNNKNDYNLPFTKFNDKTTFKLPNVHFGRVNLLKLYYNESIIRKHGLRLAL